MSPMADEPATSVPKQIGSFTIEKVLEDSASATIYLARKSAADPPVELTLPPRALRGAPDVLARFRKEAEAAAAVEHPGLAGVLGLEEHEGIPVRVSTHVEGERLNAILKKSGKLPASNVADILRRLLEALGAAHQKGVVHRVLTPKHVRLTHDGQPIITGLGHPRLNTRERKAAGIEKEEVTAYTSPEEIRGEALTNRTDFYRLGATCYHMLTGHPPYQEPTLARLQMMIGGKGEPTMIRQLQRDVPIPLARVVQKLMSKNSQSRYFKSEVALRDLTGDAPGRVEAPAHRALRTKAIDDVDSETRRVEEPVAAPRSGLPAGALWAGLGMLAIGAVIGFFIIKSLVIPESSEPTPPGRTATNGNSSQKDPPAPDNGKNGSGTEAVTTGGPENGGGSMPDPVEVKVTMLKGALPDLFMNAQKHADNARYKRAGTLYAEIAKRITDAKVTDRFPDELKLAKHLRHVSTQLYNAVNKIKASGNPDAVRADLQRIHGLIAKIEGKGVREHWDRFLDRHEAALAEIPLRKIYQELTQAWKVPATADPEAMKTRYAELEKFPDSRWTKLAHTSGKQLYTSWTAQLKRFIEDEDVINAPPLIKRLTLAFSAAPWAAELQDLEAQVKKLLEE